MGKKRSNRVEDSSQVDPENGNLPTTTNKGGKKGKRRYSEPRPPMAPPFLATKNHITLYEILKTLANCFFLGPIRGMLQILILSFIAVSSIIIGLKQPRDNDGNVLPFTGFSDMVRTRFLRPFARIFLWTCGMRIRVHGKPCDPTEAPIIVSNHVSFFEVFYFAWAIMPAFIAKKQLKKVLGIGQGLRATQSVIVDKRDKDSREACGEEIKRRMGVPGFKHILVFPEVHVKGTTTNGKYLINFRSGAFAPGVPVQPVIIRYPYRFLDISWPQNHSFWTSWLWCRMTTQFENYMEVEYMPVYHPSEEEKKDPILYGENVRQKMSEFSGLPPYNMPLKKRTSQESVDEVQAPETPEQVAKSPDLEIHVDSPIEEVGNDDAVEGDETGDTAPGDGEPQEPSSLVDQPPDV